MLVFNSLIINIKAQSELQSAPASLRQSTHPVAFHPPFSQVSVQFLEFYLVYKEIDCRMCD